MYQLRCCLPNISVNEIGFDNFTHESSIKAISNIAFDMTTMEVMRLTCRMRGVGMLHTVRKVKTGCVQLLVNESVTGVDQLMKTCSFKFTTLKGGYNRYTSSIQIRTYKKLFIGGKIYE